MRPRSSARCSCSVQGALSISTIPFVPWTPLVTFSRSDARHRDFGNRRRSRGGASGTGWSTESSNLALLTFGVSAGATLVGISHASFPLPRLRSLRASGPLARHCGGTFGRLLPLVSPILPVTVWRLATSHQAEVTCRLMRRVVPATPARPPSFAEWRCRRRPARSPLASGRFLVGACPRPPQTPRHATHLRSCLPRGVCRWSAPQQRHGPVSWRPQ